MKCEVPVWEKATLTLEEAAAYSNVGVNRLREISDAENCNFVLWVGKKRLIKRKLFEAFLEKSYSI
ncbi:MAG: transposase [Oscillospiraceae bacterium]|jgi:excisionase family DNA binding protein|nr:transposase [Oscillospiraceae bacterium]